MANPTREFIYDTPRELKCPVCETSLQVIAHVEINSGSVRHVGTPGFGEKTMNVSVDTNIVRFSINHECIYKKPKERR